jgi:hypothetical protein
MRTPKGSKSNLAYVKECVSIAILITYFPQIIEEDEESLRQRKRYPNP